MAWEVDWSHLENTGSRVWARNPTCHIRKCREWRLVSNETLRRAGVNVPTYRKDSWEIDWSKRNEGKVWARNPYSKMPSAREWHWVDQGSVNRAGVKWKPVNTHTGRYIDSAGYVTLTRMAMTDEEIELANKHGLFRGTRKTYVKEHHLVAVKKYGEIPEGMLIRHLNGDKADNRPENLVLGTTKENSMDHRTATLMMMYWREKYEEAKKEMERLRGLLGE